MRMQGKVVIITGGAGAIGAATARRLLSDGARVALFDRNADALAKLAATLGEGTSTHTVDIADESAVRAGIEAVARHHGRIDGGVLNAGISHDRTPLQDLSM